MIGPGATILRRLLTLQIPQNGSLGPNTRQHLNRIVGIPEDGLMKRG